MLSEIAVLQRVHLRDTWLSEPEHFTPWLAENISFLGDAIGLPLEVEAKEQWVGTFRADIVARETTRNALVLIENQLERTDHGHLGQLITYASGLQAGIVIWVAREFTEEHRAALDWLNAIVASQDMYFFGLEIEVWRIGESPVAPKFNVVCKPNGWKKKVLSQAGQGTNKQAQICLLLENPDLTVTEIARQVGVTKGYVSQVKAKQAVNQ